MGKEGAGKQRKGEERCAGSQENGKGLSMAGWRACSDKGTGPWLAEEGCMAASGYLSIAAPWHWGSAVSAACQHTAACQQLDHTAAMAEREVCL